MLDTLISSRVRVKLLIVFFLSPGNRYNAHQLSKILEENYSAVWKELNTLESIALVFSEDKQNRKEYWVNTSNPIFNELQKIILKTEGVAKILQEEIASSPNLTAAFIYGSFAHGTADINSDIDVCLIGDINLLIFSTRINQWGKKLGRPINYVVYSVKEWSQKVETRDPFILNILKEPKIMILGDGDELSKLDSK